MVNDHDHDAGAKASPPTPTPTAYSSSRPPSPRSPSSAVDDRPRKPTPTPSPSGEKTAISPSTSSTVGPPSSTVSHTTALPLPDDLEKGQERLPHGDNPPPPEQDIAQRKKDESDPNLVEWEEGEKENPYEWSSASKYYHVLLTSMLVLNATFASSIPSGAIVAIQGDLGLSEEVATLIISLFVAGYILGPIFWAPLSELYGRRPLFVISFFCYTLFNIGCALAKNTATILVCRFLGGTFAAAPLTNAGGVIADLFAPQERSLPMSIFCLAPYLGPVLAPMIGGFIGMNVTWRWVFWVLLIFSGVFTAITALTLKETYGPVLLVKKARRVRRETGNEARYAPLERQDMTIKAVFTVALTRPFFMLFTEPIVALVSIYVAFVYGILYLQFESFPIIFEGVYHFNAGESGLAFVSIGIGAVLAVLLNPTFDRLYLRQWKENGGPIPEARLLPTFLAGPTLVIGYFWIGWTARPSIHWICPMLAGIPIGFGILFVFSGFLTYLADVYRIYAASALAANTMARSSLGAAFPLFARQMYSRLGIPWASSLLGFLALLMAPVPILFYKYGQRIRRRSRFAFE